MRNLFLAGLSLAVLLAGAAQAAPQRGGFAPIPQPKLIGSTSAPEAKPFRPYQGFSIYHDRPTDLSPSRRPGYEPGLTPGGLKPFPREGMFGPSGGTLQNQRRSRF
jgi:hypothetical protein